jgi:hypothetical protein
MKYMEVIASGETLNQERRQILHIEQNNDLPTSLANRNRENWVESAPHRETKTIHKSQAEKKFTSFQDHDSKAAGV